MTPLRERRGQALTRVLGDAGIAVAALAAAFWLRIHLPLPFTQGLLPADRIAFLGRDWLVAAAVQLAALYFLGFYDADRPLTAAELSRRLLPAAIGQAALLAGYVFFANRTFPRSVLLLYALLDLILLVLWRRLASRGGPRALRRVVLVGEGAEAREVAEAIAAHRWHGLEVAGFVTLPLETRSGMNPAPPPGETSALGPRLGTIDDLPALLAAGTIDDVVLAAGGDSWQTRLLDRIAGSRPDHTNVLLLPGPFESLIGRMRYRWVHDLPLIEVVRESEWRINRPVKRLFDLIAGSLLALVLAPVLLLAALAVRLTSPGPILYRQERVGRDRRPFLVYKLRSMRVDAEAASGEVLAEIDDPRLTSIGALLRRFRIDEIPQVANVLAGTMSLVGPRPERPGFVERYLAEVPGYAERFSVAPGLTGLAQVNGDYHSSPQNKLRYELAYIANWSLGLDLSILVRTVKIVLTSRGV
ncbi:MAG TPA: sugar transferase [Thermoanaerobaculia bacterium]|jgi:exopolysaccharide biosynthesis polyprenyl glycosylphosphotransferase|nr:sugar transferase [Thermoanaerobaculia bacterium]